MGFKVLTLFVVLIISNIECQRFLSGLQGLDRQLPVIGACDRIAARGVTNCMENFLPSRILSGLTGDRANSGICCNYSKYKACITGLHDGLRIAMERERCPKSYSTRIIKSFGDSFVGLPLQTMCQSNDGSKCRRTSNKKKNNRDSPRRTSVDESPSVLGSALQPTRGIFGQSPKRKPGSEESTSILDPVLQPVRNIFGQNPKSRGSSDEPTSLLEPATRPFRDIFDQTSKRSGSGEPTSILDPVLQPVRNIFGQTPKGTSSSDESTSILDPILSPVRNVFGRFPSL